MTFRVNGIKQKQSGNLPIVLVVDSDSSLLVRKLLEKYNILVLDISEYNQEIKTFGDVWVKVKWWFDGITLVSDDADIQNVCKNFLEIGLDIIEINSFAHPLSTGDMETLLETTRTLVDAETATEKQVIQTKKAEQKKIYNDPKLADAKEVVARIFGRIPILMQNLEWTMNGKSLKQISVRQEDLKKLRMGNNFEKIRDLAINLLALMWEWELVYFDQQKITSHPIFPNSVVMDSDFAREEMNLIYAQQRRLLGKLISVHLLDSSIGWNISIFLTFLQKDLFATFTNPTLVLYHLYDALLLCVIFLLSIAGSFVLYNLIWPLVDNLSIMWLPMIKIGCFGLLLWLGSFWKKKDIWNLILIGVLIALAYRLLTWLIITNFAL